jgi:hypothetical protein
MIRTSIAQAKLHMQGVAGFDPKYHQVILFAEQEDWP